MRPEMPANVGVRVLHVIPSLSAAHGGPSAAVRSIEQVLQTAGMQVDIATTDDDGPGRHLAVSLGTCTETEGTRRWYFHKDTEAYKVSLGFARWIRHAVRDYDLLHIHALFSFTSGMAARAARQAGVPFVLRPLGTLSPWGLGQRRPLLKRVSFVAIERPALKSAAAIHCTSDAERDDVARLGFGARAVVIPLALPDMPLCIAPQLPSAARRPYVLCMSRLHPIKNIEALLAAFRLVQAAWPAVDLVVAGTGDPAYVRQLEETAVFSGAERVRWVGQVEGDAKAALLREATVFVLPSWSESFGLVVAEALANGVPCVVTPGVALSDMIARHALGTVVEPQASALAAGIDMLLRQHRDDPAHHAEVRERAHAIAAAEFAPALLGTRLVALYDRILGTAAA